MSRLLLTFPTLHQVLAAEKALRTASQQSFSCRPTPTPPGLGTAICGMSIEVLDPGQKGAVLCFLADNKLSPHGVHEVAE